MSASWRSSNRSMGTGSNITPRSDKGFSGKWQGQYTYGANYGPKRKGISVPFTVLLQVEGSGKVTGECLDDGYADQIDAKAVIEGMLINGQIEFVKKYRYYWQTGEDGKARENERRKGQEVHYAGAYNHGVF